MYDFNRLMLLDQQDCHNLFEKILFTYVALLLMHVFISFNNNHNHTY